MLFTCARSGEVAKVIARLVDRRDAELVWRNRRLDKVEDLVDSLQRVVHVCRIVPSIQMTEGLADVEPIGYSGQRVQTQHDVHAVSLDSVIGDGSKVDLLIAMMQPGPENVDPRGVRSGDAQSVDAHRRKLVDVGCGNKSRVVVLESDSTGSFADCLAESPFVGHAGSATTGKQIWSQGVFDCQPSTWLHRRISLPVRIGHNGRGQALTDVSSMSLVRIPSLKLLPIHFVTLEIRMFRLAVPGVLGDVDNLVWSVLPGIGRSADAQARQDVVERLTGSHGDRTNDVADCSWACNRCGVDDSRSGQSRDGKDTGILHRDGEMEKKRTWVIKGPGECVCWGRRVNTSDRVFRVPNIYVF